MSIPLNYPFQSCDHDKTNIGFMIWKKFPITTHVILVPWSCSTYYAKERSDDINTRLQKRIRQLLWQFYKKLLFFNAIYELEETLQFAITFNVYCFCALGRLQGLEHIQCESRWALMKHQLTDVSQGWLVQTLNNSISHLYKDLHLGKAIIS